MSTTIDKISVHIDELSKRPRANSESVQVLMLARERIERLEAALGVVVEQAKRSDLTLSTIFNAECLLHETR